MNKRGQLIQLRSKIIDQVFKKRWEDVWFFPKRDGINGYLGTQDIIFLGLNPATANWSWHDRMYYGELKKYNFGNAHLTDIFKVRKTNDNVKYLKTYQKESKQFLEKEISIIRPKLIVLLGQQVSDEYINMFSNSKIKTISIGHYSFRYGDKEKLRSRFSAMLKEVRKKYNRL